MNSVKYVMNAVVVGLLLHTIYIFIGNLSVIIYPKLGVSSYELRLADHGEYGSLYSTVEFCLKEDKLSRRENCVKKLDKERGDKHMSGLFGVYRFNAFKHLVNKFLLLIVIFAYFVFFRKLISIGEFNKSDKYESAYKPSYKRAIRK